MSDKGSRTFALLLALATSLPGFSVASAEEAGIDQFLADYDQSIVRFKRDVWNVQRLDAMFGRDFRGRTLSDDLRDYIFLKPMERRALEQRATVEKQRGKDPKAALATLEQMNRAIKEESAKLDDIFIHRLRFRQIARLRDLWREQAEGLPSYKAPVRIETLEQESVERLNGGEFSQVTFQIYPDLQKLYSEERAKLLARKRNVGAIFYSRRSPCGAPAKATSGKPLPALVSQTTPTYPSESRRWSEEGTTLLQIVVAPSGCAIRYAIVNSSGWPTLDDAALDWVETTSFAPALKDGKATESSVALPVVFKLNE